jgi:DNA-binding CsgD family transcriptional regulator/tetratricopeptide (TPR) repeat protein
LRDVVSRRLSRLGSGTNQTLSVASVLGREFAVTVLSEVQARTPDDIEADLAEAVAAGILEERSVVGSAIRFRFTHAFFRQTLYEAIVAPRRTRLHRDVARSLERLYSPRQDEHAAELAEHFVHSSDPPDRAQGVHYGRLAAAQAFNVFAFREAVRQLERALQVDLLDPDDSLRCDLLLDLARALSPIGGTERVIDIVAPEALAIADRLGDQSRAFRACMLVLDCLTEQGAGTSTARAAYGQWATRAVRYATPDSMEMARADLALANAVYALGQTHEARTLRLQALSMARRHGDYETVFTAAFDLLLLMAPHHWTERFKLADEAITWPRDGVSTNRQARVLFMAGALELCRGDRQRAELWWNELEVLAERTQVATTVLFSLQRIAILAIVDGRLEEALTAIEHFANAGERLGAATRAQHFKLLLLFAPLVYLGRAEEWLANLRDFRRIDGSAIIGQRLMPYQAACLVHLGRMEEARALVTTQLDAEGLDNGDPERNANLLLPLLETAVLLGHRPAAATLARRLDCLADLSVGDWFFTSVARHLGAAAALSGDRAGALRHLTQALQSASRIGFRPEIALTHLHLAELLSADPSSEPRAQAREHLQAAIGALQAMHMQPALDRALRLSIGIEDPRVSPHRPQATANPLTRREREVATHIAAGYSNREIAEVLVISEGTVDVHVKHILKKLDARSRSQVAAWIVQQEQDGSPDKTGS